MNEPLTKDSLLCRLFGHRWRASHRSDLSPYGLRVWVYTDHVCLRCYQTKYLLPDPRERPLSSCGLESL